MAEVLVVMAIIMVLSGIAVPNATRILNNARQMSLNRSAETIYMTAQRNLIAYKVRNSSASPPGADNMLVYDNESGIYTVTSFQAHDSTNAGNAVANTVLSAKTISPTLYAGNWTIKYKDFLVTAVYYSEDVNQVSPTIESVYTSGELGKAGYYGE